MLVRQGSSRGAWAMQLVADVERACVYRATERARCPTYWPEGRLGPEQLDDLLEQGYQRVGHTVFRTACPMCRACQPVRIPIASFQRTKSQRRVWQRNQDLKVVPGPLMVNAERVDLWIGHRLERGLLTGDADDLDSDVYGEVLGRSCAPTAEIRYLLDGQLVALSFLDFGRTSANSAYHFFHPDHAWRSLGVYSVLREIELCRERGMSYYYMGLWAADARALRYKTNYLPHERLIEGQWVHFEAAEDWEPPPPRETPLALRVPTVQVLKRRW